jgi:AraC family transcriptional regulator of adaptative response/methylated-DNA-[protein]-cysteine methyltransferase
MPDDLFDAIEHSFNTGDRSSLTFDLRGATPFQQSVWEACLAIPAGETRTYADLARSIHRPNAVRAVGTALGANPIPVLIPCHRVLRSDGSLGGYAFGLPIKERLLDREAVRAAA